MNEIKRVNGRETYQKRVELLGKHPEHIDGGGRLSMEIVAMILYGDTWEEHFYRWVHKGCVENNE